MKVYKITVHERYKTKGIWYKTIPLQPLKSPWIDDITDSHREAVTGMKLRSGNIPPNKFTFMMSKVPFPLY